MKGFYETHEADIVVIDSRESSNYYDLFASFMRAISIVPVSGAIEMVLPIAAMSSFWTIFRELDLGVLDNSEAITRKLNGKDQEVMILMVVKNREISLEDIGKIMMINMFMRSKDEAAYSLFRGCPCATQNHDLWLRTCRLGAVIERKHECRINLPRAISEFLSAPLVDESKHEEPCTPEKVEQEEPCSPEESNFQPGSTASGLSSVES